MSEYVAEISQAGNDVLTATPDTLAFSSKYPMFKIKERGTAQLRIYRTALNGGITDVQTTIPVTSTAGFPTSGTFWIVDFVTEAVDYTGISGNSFTGCTRGARGTSYSGHMNGIDVVQADATQIITHNLGYPPVHIVARDTGTLRYIIPEYLDPTGVAQVIAEVTSTGLRLFVTMGDELSVSSIMPPSNSYTAYNLIYTIMWDSITSPYY